MPVRHAWYLRHPNAFACVLVLGVLAVGTGLTIGAHVPARGAFALPGLIFVLGFPPLMRRVNRRQVRSYADDPNVLWPGLVRIDRLELLRARLEPTPPKRAGSSVVLLVTRNGLALRPVSDTTAWPGMSIPASRIQAAEIGWKRLGNRSFPALKLLIGADIVTFAISSGADGLAEALRSSSMSSRMSSDDDFLRQAVNAELLDEHGAPPADELIATVRRTWRRAFALRFGIYMGVVIVGLAVGLIGNALRSPFLGALGLALFMGAVLWMTVSSVRSQLRIARQRKNELAEHESRQTHAG